MNEKKQSGKKRLFLLVLVAFGIVLWITFTNLNRIALRHTLDETIGFVNPRLLILRFILLFKNFAI